MKKKIQQIFGQPYPKSDLNKILKVSDDLASYLVFLLLQTKWSWAKPAEVRINKFWLVL